MYVIPFVMGHLEAENPMFGVEITDSAYVTVSMRVMARMGTDVLAQDGGARRATFVPALHSVGMPLEPRARPTSPGRATTPSTSCSSPRSATIWSFGSGYGGNALLGKKCYALRIASVMARDEGWMAEHMLILKLTIPAGRHQVRRRGVPERLRQDQPRDAQADHPRLEGRDASATTSPGCGSARTAGCGRSTRSTASSASRPAPTSTPTPTRCETINKGNSVFTNVALTEDGDVWWEGLENPPAKATSLEGRALDARRARSCPATPTAATARRSSSATSSPRSTTTRAASRSTRSSSAAAARPPIPLVTEARDWTHGTFLGATLSSRDHRRRGRRRSASCAATRWRCCRSSATTPATTSATGSTWARTTTRRRCRASSTSTGSAATTTAASCGPASARTAGSSSGSSSASRARPPRSRPRSATCRRRARSTSTAST